MVQKNRQPENWIKKFSSAVPLSLFFLIFLASPSFADIRQWDFDNAEDYQFDQKKVQLQDGTAKLVPSSPYHDAGQSFQRGQFDLNTTTDRGTLELSARGFQETPGPELPSPVGNREPGVAALWHLDEPSGTNLLDSVGRTVAKATDSEVVSGQTGFGYARNFDGEKSFVFIPHYESLALRGPFSVEAWIRPGEVRTAKPQTLISRWQTIGAQRGFAFQISTDGKLDFLVSADGATVTHQTGATVMTPNVWYHAAAVFNGQDLRVYLNGVLDNAPVPFTGPVYFSNNPIYLGALVDNRVDQFYKGVMDEAGIYGKALSETEVLTRFGNPQGVVGIWHLNERGGVLTDASGYGHNGTAEGQVRYEAEGRMGTALEFGPNSYVKAAASSRLAPQGQMTLQAWIKPAGFPGVGQRAAVLSIYEEGKDGSPVKGGGEFSLSVSGPEGRVSAFASKLQPSEVKGRLNLVPGVWHHVAVTWTQGEVRIYNNGVLDTVAPYTGSLDFSQMGLRIGSDAKGSGSFQGTIDEAAVYRRARTSREIAESAGLFAQAGIYTSDAKDAGNVSPWRSMDWKLPLPYGQETDGRETGLLHIYHLNDGEGSGISDAKGSIQASPIGTYPVPGIFGSARWFAAKGYDKILSQKDFPSLSTFSISLWFEFSSGQPGLNDRLFSIGDGNPTVFRGPDGRMRVQMQGAREIVGERVLGDTGWHHLTLTGDGRSLFLYIDGLLDGNSPFISATAQSPLVLGNLKSTDSFQGAIDEVLFYNYPLDRETILQQYLRGQMDAKMLVRSSESRDFSNTAWRGPQGVRLSEEPSMFTTGLWHLDENVFRAQPAEIGDAGHFANLGTVFGKVSRFPVGVSGSALELNGSTDYVRVADTDSLHMDKFTLSAWVRPAGMADGQVTIFDKQFKAGAPVFSSFALDLLGGNKLAFRLGRPGGYRQIESGRDGEVAAGRWNHVAAVYDRKEVRLYINGKKVKAARFEEPVPYDDGPLYFGRYGSSDTRFFRGALDEIHFQNTAATDEEIQTRFAQSNPENFFRPFESVDPGVPAARYFQYRLYLNSDLAFASPAVSEVNLQGASFPADKPSITPAMGVSYAEITNFSDEKGKRNAGSVTYQLSPDGANWFFHNGRHWVIAAGANESNTAQQVQARVNEFAKEAGMGSFYFRAFLQSPTGAEPAELDSVEVEYLPNKVTVIAPNGGEALLAGSQQVIRWNSIGELQKVNIEYSKDNFKNDFHEIAHAVPNTGSYDWKVPEDLSVNVKVRVMDSLDPRIYDMSDITFRTTGKIDVFSPNWNERWEAGTEQKILWKTEGPIPQVKIEFSTDDFQHMVYPIVDSVKNEGEYIWKIPDHISTNVKVRISDVRDPEVFDKSNDTFAITGRLAINSPEAGVRWLAGSQQEIRWQSSGTIPLVHLEYKNSKKEDWIRIAENFEGRGSSYMWKVPDDLDLETRVRVLDAGDSKVSAESAPFSIIGGLRLLNPKGGEQWTAGTRRKIAWETVGTIPTVDIQYQTSQGGEWQNIETALANTGTYIWEVPASITGPINVRVVDSHDSTVQALHASASSVIPGFHIKSPAGGEEWKIGTEQNIQWETTGDAQRVKIEYSKDGFVNDVHEIIAAASNLGSYTWAVADDATLNAKIRVSDAGNAAAQAVSNAPFRIYGGFEVEIPKGGEKFEVGSMATFVWKTLGTVPDVRLEYSHDDFRKDTRLIETSAPNEGKYTWTVPDDIGNGYQLRIADVRDPKTEAFSEQPFSVIGNFRLLYPVGGEDLIAGTVARVAWKGAGSVSVVRIDYSEDDFQKSFNTIANKAPNNGIYEWTVPNLIGRKFKLRIWDPSQPDSIDVMEQPARIVGGFRLLEPNGGEVLFVGDRAMIKWETSGTMPRVKLEFSADNFTKDISAIADSYPNNGQYDWLVPNAPSGKYKVRISDPHDVTAFDISNSDFIIRSRFNVQSPNGGEGWPVGSRQTIRWQSSAAVGQVKLDYSTDDFKSVSLIDRAAPNTGIYEWVVPDTVSQNAVLRVSDAQDGEAADTSDKPFRIQGVLTVVAPNGKEIWKTGEQRAITWQTSGQIEGVRLEYSRDAFASESKVIVESTPNTGHYNWTVPDDISAQVKVRVMDVKDGETQDMSDASFEIVGSFVVLAPNGGESWHATEKREITWMTVGTVKDISLDYTTDNFRTINPIEHGLMNTGRYTWEVPDALGETYKVRICDADNPHGCDDSDNVFAIRSPLEMTTPRGGEKWVVGADQEIRWNTYGTVNRVFVSYSARTGEWKKLIEELPNENHFLFRVPDDISETVFFKVTNYDNENLSDISRGPVSILGTFDLIRPNGGEKWAAGTTQKISWDNLGAVTNARLEYSTDDFKSQALLIEPSMPNTGSYEWTVPGEVLSSTVKVRISDADHPESFDISKDVFKIMPGITLVSPNGNEKWFAGTKEKVVWKTVGKSDWVKLEYSVPRSTPAGGSPASLKPEAPLWTTIADKVPNGGEYVWDIPAQNGAEFLVRVSDLLDPDASDVSDIYFEVKPRLVLNHPTGKENFFVGSPAEILWDTIGKVPAVNIEYSLDNFQKDIRVVSGKIPNEGKLLWVVPDAITDNAKILVRSSDDGAVRVQSEAPFKILPSFEMLQPAGLEKWTVGTEQTLKWNWTGTLETVRLEYSINDFVSSTEIVAAAPNKGFFQWQVPDLAHSQTRIRVSHPMFPQASAVSQSFSIIPGFKVTAPNGGEKLIAGERTHIEWQTAGLATKVKLEYGIENGDTTAWKTIENVVRNSGRYEWRVPEELSSKVKIRVSDVLDSAAFDESDQTFKILGVFKILAPKADELLRIDDRYQVRWETRGKVPSVRLEYSSTPEQAGSFRPIENFWGNTGSYYWTVPDAAGEKVWLKISDALEADTFALSPAPFKIRGSLAWDIPVEAGGLDWPVATVQTLKWKTVGSIPRVNLEYTVDQKIWKTIASGVTNSGSYGWTIPDDTAQGVKLRVTDADHPIIFDIMSQPLTISAQFAVESPKAGDIWTVGSAQKITWHTTGHVQKVWLEYMTDGKKWQSLAGPLPDTGSLDWTVPDKISSDVKVRVFDGDNHKASAKSGSFRITGALKLGSPLGAEVWEVGSRQKLEWATTGSIPKVRLEAFEEELNAAPAGTAQSVLVIADSLNNKGSFEWTVPDRISDKLKVRVVDARDPLVNSVSSAPFSVIAHFEVKNPKGSDIWTVGSEHEIVWASAGTVPAVRMEYSRDDFYREIAVIASDVPNTGAAAWTIPDAISNAVKVRVSDPRDARASAVSEPFKVRGAFSFLKPEPNMIWRVGSKQRIEWQTLGTIPAVTVAYSRDDFQKDVQVLSNVRENQNSLEWTVPDIISNAVKLRVMDEKDATVFAVSNPFKVEGGLALKAPLGGEKFQVLSTQKISWDTIGSIQKVRLEYSKDDFIKDTHVIAADLKNEGSFDWLVPDEVGDSLKVRVMDAGDFSVSSSSPGAFAVRGSVSLTTPMAGQRWAVGSEQEITWETVGTVPFVRVEYSKDDFQKDIHVIAENIVNHGKVSWSVADDISSTVRLRVFDAAHGEIFSASTEPASIVGGLEFTSVTAGTVAVVGEPTLLKWNTRGTIPVVRLEYAQADVSGGSAQDWKLVAGSLENKGEFSWVAPDFISNRVVLRVSDARDPLTYHVSPVFTITGKLTMALPAGGERWIVGTTHDLVWNTSGSIGSVFLEYSSDGFKKDIRPVSGEPVVNTGRFQWPVPDNIFDQIQVRVRDAASPKVMSESGVFSIAGDLSFTNPSGPAAWQIGVSQVIEWQTVGTIPFVRLEYMAADGREGQEAGALIAPRIENTGKFQWDIPDGAPAKIKLRVVNADDTAVFDETPEPVRVFGVLNFTAPSGAQSWTVGDTQDIAWSTRGIVPNVKLEFSRDGFKKDVQTMFPLLPNTGSVQWQVPDIITSGLTLRISDADNPRIFAQTLEPVSVRGALSLTAPLDGVAAEVGQKQEIVWKTMGSIVAVNLEYSTDGFTAGHFPIALKVPNNGHYTWDIPEAARQKLSVRVSDASDPGVFSVSRAFGVHGKLELLSPRGGEIWKVDDSARIEWRTLGNIGFVKLEYSSDEFITPNLIAGRVENRGDFMWHVPASINEPIKIRISDSDDPDVTAVTATALKVQGVFEFLAPQGGEFWISRTEQPVIWQSRGAIPYVNLEYSTDNFNTASPVMLGFANEGRFKFTVPDLASDSLKFRISDARDQSVSAVSGPVRAGGRIELLLPSGEILKVGDETVIRWKTTGLVPKVKLEISGDGFKNDVRLIQDGIDNQESYAWKIPDRISGDQQVRVTDIKHSDIFSVSAVPFKIAGAIRITAPQAGETWPVSSRKTLEWETTGSIPFVRVEYSKDNFISSVPVDLHLRNTGRLEWTVPDLSGDQIQFRVSDANDPAVADVTRFSIAIHGVLSLTSPVGGEVWKARTEHPITWTTVGTVPNVSLSYISGASVQPVKIADSIANTGSYVWTVPDKTLASLKVRVSDSKHPYIFSESPVFETRGTLELAAPQGGEIWIVGTQHPIQWNSTGGIEKVRVEYSVDNFNTVVPVAMSLANEGRYQWRVPDSVSRNAQVRVSDASQPAVISESRPFEIRGALTLINPIGGEEWAVGSRHPISWETTGTVPSVRIEYSTDDFQKKVFLIAPSAGNKGVFYWDIPSIDASSIKVRVVDPANPDVFDISRNPVSIAGSLELLAPGDGEIFRVGEKIQVRWRSTPNVANVKLEYSVDDFKTSTLISNYVPNTGSFDWNIPDRISEYVRLRVSDAANSIVSAVSRVPFQIRGGFRFTSPAGDQTWPVGSRQRISWDTLGSVQKVRLEYSSDNFKTAVPIAANLDNQGTFDWEVPETGNDIQLRVSDASVSSVQDVTDGKIHVVGRLEFVSPVGGERWVVGEERMVRWRILGLMPKVSLEYSKDNFYKDVHLIAADLPNLGTYSWKVPNDPSASIKLRVRNSNDARISSVSEAIKVDYNHVTWTVRDARTSEHLIGLTLTDTTGKTRSGLSSPLVLDYPYGIYTTVWSKPGYGEFRSTWLADHDMNFTVTLTPEEKAVENVRFDFRYDRERDLMAIRSWYEKDGAPVSAVVQSEVKIYKGTELIKTLVSTTPDNSGNFSMVWDTHQVAGNTRYVASAFITGADGRLHASPVSYQLDIPVKELKEPVARQSVSSVYLKPLALPAASPAVPSVPAVEEKSATAAEPVKPARTLEELEGQPVKSAPAKSAPAESRVQAPSEAVLNETISIVYSGGPESRPVLDLYDANRRLMVRAATMESKGPGQFVYLLPIKGSGFIPGKPVTATVVDLVSQQFKSVSIMIKSASAAAGMDRNAGLISVPELIGELNAVLEVVENFEKHSTEWEEYLPEIENRLNGLAGSLIQTDLPPVVLEKLNSLSSAMAHVLAGKGYDGNFLTQAPLKEGASALQVQGQVRLLQEALQMIRRLHLSIVGR